MPLKTLLLGWFSLHRVVQISEYLQGAKGYWPIFALHFGCLAHQAKTQQLIDSMTGHAFDWQWLQKRAKSHGLDCVGVTDTNLSASEPYLQAWLNNGMHGEMEYMARHGLKRLDADTIMTGTIRIISVRVNYVPEPYLPQNHANGLAGSLSDAQSTETVHISLYARGRDYHKLIRQQLKRFAEDLSNEVGSFGYRVAVDSAPTPEVEIARKAGLGWRGKHTLLIHPKAGSLFFLGEIFTNLPIDCSEPFEQGHCGQCNACIDVCPTQAIVAPGVVDARRCISYLTIEHQSAIPLELREAIGTRLYGCDDCQLACPWNKFAQPASLGDFAPRHGFDDPDISALLGWTEDTFLKNTEGMAMRRIGYRLFQRNLAVVSGNLPPKPEIRQILKKKLLTCDDDMLREHWVWALEKQSQHPLDIA